MLGQMESDKGQPEKKIKELTKVRNELAHSWSESDVILQERRKRKSYQYQKQYKRIQKRRKGSMAKPDQNLYEGRD